MGMMTGIQFLAGVGKEFFFFYSQLHPDQLWD